MQHLDEGTIHSWLDGALSANEAARVKAHVKECPQCASAVADARGFIAASSRILTALDNAPRGVVPVAAPRRRVDPIVWRVAATVLVVAAGTLVVLRTTGSNSTSEYSSIEEPDSNPTPKPAPPIIVQANPTRVAPIRSQATSTLSERIKVATDETKADKKVAAENSLTAAATTPALAQTGAAGVAVMDAATESEPLKVVGNPRRIGAKVTLYEVAQGDTVTLTESIPTSLSSVVVTGTSVAPMARGAMQKSSAARSETRADASIAAAPDSQRAAGAMSPAPAVSAPARPRQAIANTLQTITWIDPMTGNTLTLTGRGPEARLQEIRIRIERERAAAAAKKSP
jgi:anti-sigma factor RsiW